MLASTEDIEAALINEPQLFTFTGTPVRGEGSGSGAIADPFEAVPSSEIQTELMMRIGSLPARERWLLFFWYGERLPVTDIARFLKISRVACYRLRRRAIDRLVAQVHLAAVS